jgi:hypothetical protein
MAKTNTNQANGTIPPVATSEVVEQITALTKQTEELQAKYKSECDAHAETMTDAENLSKKVKELEAENEALRNQIVDAEIALPPELRADDGVKVKLCNLAKKGKKMMVGDGSGAVVVFDENGCIEVSTKEATRLLANKAYRKVE